MKFFVMIFFIVVLLLSVSVSAQEYCKHSFSGIVNPFDADGQMGFAADAPDLLRFIVVNPDTLTYTHDYYVSGIIDSACSDTAYHPCLVIESVSQFNFHNPIDTGCCVGMTGDVNLDDSYDISDLLAMVDWMFNSEPVPPCMDELDVDGSGVIDISDLLYYIDIQFIPGDPFPAGCKRYHPDLTFTHKFPDNITAPDSMLIFAFTHNSSTGLYNGTFSRIIYTSPTDSTVYSDTLTIRGYLTALFRYTLSDSLYVNSGYLCADSLKVYMDIYDADTNYVQSLKQVYYREW